MASLFVKPDVSAFAADPKAFYYKNYLTYSHYNYLRPGLISKVVECQPIGAVGWC